MSEKIINAVYEIGEEPCLFMTSSVALDKSKKEETIFDVNIVKFDINMMENGEFPIEQLVDRDTGTIKDKFLLNRMIIEDFNSLETLYVHLNLLKKDLES